MCVHKRNSLFPVLYTSGLLILLPTSSTAVKLLLSHKQEHNPWVGKINWKRERQPTPVFLTGESQGQESLEGYSPRGCKQSDMTEQLSIAHTTQEKEKPYGNSNFDRIFRVSHLAHGRIIVNGTTYYQQKHLHLFLVNKKSKQFL